MHSRVIITIYMRKLDSPPDIIREASECGNPLETQGNTWNFLSARAFPTRSNVALIMRREHKISESPAEVPPIACAHRQYNCVRFFWNFILFTWLRRWRGVRRRGSRLAPAEKRCRPTPCPPASDASRPAARSHRTPSCPSGWRPGRASPSLSHAYWS